MVRPLQRRPFGRVRAFAALAGQMARVPLWLMTGPKSARARHHERRFFVGVSRGFGIEPRIFGEPVVGEATLFVCNHISWADIAVLASLLDARFVAKSDIARWPVIGGLARRFGPVFVDRDNGRRSGDQNEAIRAELRAGRSVILFPEATTSDGTALLPFKSSLLAAADSAATIQPLAMRYLDAGGAALSPVRQRQIAWIGDDDLLTGAARVAREHTVALVHFLPPLAPAEAADRKHLARRLHALIADAYAAAPNLSR